MSRLNGTQKLEKIRKDRQYSRVLVWLILRKLFQGMKVLNCNWIWKINYFVFFLRFSVSSSVKRLKPYQYYCSASHLSNFQPPDQTIFLSQTFRLDHGTRPHQQPIRSAPDKTTTPDNQTRIRSDHWSDHAPTLTPDHRQTRPPPPHQTTRSDQPDRLPSLTAPLQISTGHPSSWAGTG